MVFIVDALRTRKRGKLFCTSLKQKERSDFLSKWSFRKRDKDFQDRGRRERKDGHAILNWDSLKKKERKNRKKRVWLVEERTRGMCIAIGLDNQRAHTKIHLKERNGD